MSNNLSKHTLGLTDIQSGQGVPTHQAPLGTLYIDVTTSEYYKNTDGLNTWGSIGSGDYLPLSGGTVTGGVIFTSGITVNTISEVDYINFKTSPSVPSPTGGTLYFDSNENALSYKPVTNQNDVTVNIGQESLIRIYNDTGDIIRNGQVLHITGAVSGVPTVTLANASKLGNNFTESLAQSSGVATHDIPYTEYGFMTNFGIVRDLNTTGFTVGQELFLSDTIDGGITSDPNSIEYTSRISTIGWCLSSDPINGKIYVKIENENPLQSLTQQELNILVGNTISTGVYSYTGMTKASSTTVNVSPMRGWLVYNTYEYSTNPLVLNIYYTGGTNIPITNISTSFDTYFLVNSGGTLFQQTTYPTPEERRKNIFLGRAVHPNKTDILNVEQTVDYDVSPMSALRDLWTPIKLINQGVIPSNNGVNLQFRTSSGTFWGNGIGWDTNELNPNSITVPAYSPAHFYYTTQTGGSFTVTANTIDTTHYDVDGIITNIPGSSRYATQRIYMSQSGIIRIQYAQDHYATLARAIAAIPSETFVENSDNGIDCILIGLLTVKDGATDLSNIDDAVFTLVSKFGEILGGTGGLSTTTLQQAYNNSTSPEIITNSTLGGVQFRGGTGTNTDRNIIIENNGSNVTGYWQADGGLFVTSITGYSATINGNLTVTGNTNNIGSLSATTFYGSGLGLNNIPISGVSNLQNSLNLKTNLSDFVSHTGNTNNPHQTSFYQLTSTAHTHTISDIIDLQTNLNSKFSLSGGTVNGDVIVLGNVTILGSATTINTQTLSVADTVITLNSNLTGGTPFPGHSGIEVLRGSGTTAALLWEEQRSQWEAGLNGTTKRIILQGDSLALLNSGHTHPISQINNLQSSLDDKLSKSTGGDVLGFTSFNGGLSAYTISSNLTVIPFSSVAVYDDEPPSINSVGIAGLFDASTGLAGLKYSLQLKDGTEGINKVLVSKTTDGKANWSNSVNLGSVTATTFYGDFAYVSNIVAINSFSSNTYSTNVGNTQVTFSNNGTLSGTPKLTWVDPTLNINGNLKSNRVSGTTLVITNEPTSGITSTQILVRNSTTGEIEITDNTSPTIYNYGMTYAMTNFTYLI